MRKSQPLILAVSLTLAALFATAEIAEAQTRQKRVDPPRTLTVKKRSFLDSGQVVRVGGESNYVQSGQFLNRNADTFNTHGRHATDTLPGRFDVPRQPLFNF